jgi:phosphoesterase family protein
MTRKQKISIAAKMLIALALVSGAAAFGQVPRSHHVYIVAEENRSYEKIIGSPYLPYLNSLINKGGLATQFYANQHGSLEDYFWVTAGQKITDNNDTTAVFDVDNIERHILSKGETFKSYAQTLPYAGYTGLYYNAYLKRHAPLIYFTDMANSSLRYNHVSSSVLAHDITNGTLPNFAFITPDADHDMHNCGTDLSTCFWAADQWLKANIGPLLTTAPFQPGGDGLLIIWTDEADLSTDNRCSSTVLTGCGGRIVVAMYGPQVKGGYKSYTTYHHPSVLKTMLEALGETSTFPGAAQTAPDMREFFINNVTGSVTISAPTSSTVTGPGVLAAASANAANPITFMRLYVDSVSVYSTSAGSFSTTVNMTIGTHSMVFQAWDSAGNVYKATKTVTVQ